MVVPVPPEPVAAFSDQELLPGAVHRGRGQVRRRIVQRAPRVGQLTPRTMVIWVADPDVEITVNPGSREYRWQAFRSPGTCLAHRHGAQLGMGGQPSVQRAQERTTLSLIVLPGVLAVQDDEDGRLSPAVG